jgi:hypothetical protein
MRVADAQTGRPYGNHLREIDVNRFRGINVNRFVDGTRIFVDGTKSET